MKTRFLWMNRMTQGEEAPSMPQRTQEIEVSLEEGAIRLLHWLERYPLQRAQDVILALSPWEKRTTVYRHLASLEHVHLIEGFHTGMTQKKQLYHLSPLGRYLCDYLAFQENPDHPEKRAQWERWGHLGVGPIVREEGEKIMRLLPRLPIFLLLQEYMNSLVSAAPATLTSQGHHARMIQWNWLRDYSHTFVSREQTFRLHAEGALTLCLRFSPEETSSRMLSHTDFGETWYTLLFLHCPLDEPRLMRTRLDRLLRWRESAERTAVYSQMPPLLVLATTERQAEWWQQAATQAASRLRLDLPLGAVACLPRSAEPFWHLAFRRLGTKELCHVQELLHPLSAPSVPELLALRGETSSSGTERRRAPKKIEVKLDLPPRLRLSSYTLTRMPLHTRNAQTRIKHHSKTPSDYRWPSVLLTARHWEILRLCFAHPLLSREDVTHLLMLSRTTTNLLLADLERVGYLARVETLTGERWQLAEPGLRLLARLAFCHIHRLVRFPLEDGKPLMQRGVLGLLHQVRHTAGVYAFFAQLSEALATRPDAGIRWWETGVLSERHFQFREQLYRFRPDAEASVQLGQRAFRFWLEWDRGTMTPKDLRLKFTTYAMYLISREWASSSPYLPALLCVAPDIGQEKQVVKAALQCLVQVPSGWCVYSTTASLLLTQGILGPIWRPVEVQHHQAQRTLPEHALPRRTLFTEDNDTS